jgi:cation transport ATPase
MKAGFGNLFFWSFLMAAAHGAGLMLAPILLAQPMAGMNHSMPDGTPAVVGLSARVLGLAVVVHTLGLLVVSGTLALVVYQFYETSGLRLLQRAWFNFDLLWAIALFVAGIAALSL